MDDLEERMTNSSSVPVAFINITQIPSGNETLMNTYDAEGAMKFTVAVVTMYSIGIVGVLILSLHNRKKKNAEVDKEVDYFMKDINNVRMSLEKKGRLDSINKLLTAMNIDTKSKNIGVVGSGLLPFVALPVFISESHSQQEVTQTQKEDTDDGFCSTSEFEDSRNGNVGWYLRQESTISGETIVELDENDNENEDIGENESLLNRESNEMQTIES